MACCPPGAIGAAHTTVSETVQDFGGVKCYLAGAPTNPLVLVLNDMFGVDSGRTKQICNDIASRGYFVVMPDTFDGSYMSDKGIHSRNPLKRVGFMIRGLRYVKKYPWSTPPTKKQPEGHVTGGGQASLFSKVLSHHLHITGMEANPLQKIPIFLVSFCWGAWCAFMLCHELRGAHQAPFNRYNVVGGVHFHPATKVLSYVKDPNKTLPSKEEALVDSADGPSFFVVCSNDPKNLRTHGSVGQVIVNNGGAVYEVAAAHGFMNRGDLDDPTVKSAVAEGEKILYEKLALLPPGVPSAMASVPPDPDAHSTLGEVLGEAVPC